MAISKADALRQMYPEDALNCKGIRVEVRALPFIEALELLDLIANVVTLVNQNDLIKAVTSAKADIVRLLDRALSTPEVDEKISAADMPTPFMAEALMKVLEYSLGVGEWRAAGGDIEAKLGISLRAVRGN